jgi:hypothetical protein
MGKIFVIGFNKTATTTLHNLFLANKLKSQHDTIWQPNKFKCFSDNGDLNKFKKLDRKYPGATFILNVRSLDKWLKSRILHCYSFYLKNNKPNWGYPCSNFMCKSWIEAREKHYLELLEHFKNRPHKLIIVNIEKDNWETYISNILGLKVKSVAPANVSTNFKKKKSPSPSIFTVVDETFNELGYEDSEKKNILLRDSELTDEYIKIYRNNMV